MIDIDKLEALAKNVGAGPAAQKSADPIIRNMGRLEHDDAVRSLFRELTPANILALIAEVRALRIDADRYRRLKTFAHPSYNIKVISNAGVTSLAEEKLMTVHAFSWEAMDAVLDGVVTVNTVNVREQS